MTWLLTVDPGKRGCGCALWQERRFYINSPHAPHPGDKVDWVLHAAAYVAPPKGQDLEALGREALSAAVEATARAAVSWAQDQVQAWCKKDLRQSYIMNWRGLRLICELPRTYGGKAKKGDANDNVVPLSVVVGMISGALGCPTAFVWPQDWKGTIPKPERQSEPYIVQERVKEHLTAEEAGRVVWPGNKKLQWDVADAIGIGMAHLGRAFKKVG